MRAAVVSRHAGSCDISPLVYARCAAAQRPTHVRMPQCSHCQDYNVFWEDRIISGASSTSKLVWFADMSEKLDTVKVDTVSLPIALGLWLMMWPVLTKVCRCTDSHAQSIARPSNALSTAIPPTCPLTSGYASPSSLHAPH